MNEEVLKGRKALKEWANLERGRVDSVKPPVPQQDWKEALNSIILAPTVGPCGWLIKESAVERLGGCDDRKIYRRFATSVSCCPLSAVRPFPALPPHPTAQPSCPPAHIPSTEFSGLLPPTRTRPPSAALARKEGFRSRAVAGQSCACAHTVISVCMYGCTDV